MADPSDTQAIVSELPSDEVVGRRLRDGPGEFHIIDDGSGVRVLAGAFLETRPGAHLSVDRFWTGTPPKPEKRQAKIQELASILVIENWGPAKGWATARVDRYLKGFGLRRCEATSNATNKYHADLIKANHLIISETDKKRDVREKAQEQAHQLMDHFNNLLKNQLAEVIPFPALKPISQ